MARRLSASDPILSIDFWTSGFYTYRSQLFAPFKGIGVNVVSFHDPVIAGSNMEDTDKLEWQRRPGFSIFCPIPLADDEVVNQFYSYRNLNGVVVSLFDSTTRLASFTDTTLTPIITKTTSEQGFISAVGNMFYFSDGASADLYKFDGANVSVWGLAAPTVTPTVSGMGFWQPFTSSSKIGTILDTNGSIESLSSVFSPNGTQESPGSSDIIFIPGGGGNGGSAANWAGGAFPGAKYTETFNDCFSHYLFLNSFNFHIPAAATITGIEVILYKYADNVVNPASFVQDRNVFLVVGGTPVGSDRAKVGNWTDSGLVPYVYGGKTDLWGLTPSPADINANGLSGFGVVLSANLFTSSANVDAVVGVSSPVAPVVTIYFTVPSGTPTPGLSGATEPVWPTAVNGVVTDGGIAWSNFGPIATWFPFTNYPPPVVILDINGNLQLGTATTPVVLAWDAGTTYSTGDLVSFGGSYWISVFPTANMGVAPNSVTTATTGGTTSAYWAPASSPVQTGPIMPVWQTTLGAITDDGDYAWENIGQGTGLAFVGYSYVYGYRTVYGHLTTSSQTSLNTGAILGPLNGSITAFSITGDVVTFTGNNNFVVGNVFEVTGLTVGIYLNNQSFTVLSAVPSATFPLTQVQVTTNVVTVTALNNLIAGQTVTFNNVASASFLNGVTATVLASGLSGTQFEVDLTNPDYGPTADSGNVVIVGSWTASFMHADVGATTDTGVALPLIATITGMGTGSPLSNSVANITAVSVAANIVTLIASNNFQPGIWVTLAGLTNATFLNGIQFQVISVDKLVGTLNTQFQVFLENADYVQTADTGTATFNAIEIYRTSDGGGVYLFDGAVTNPGAGATWTYNDFVIDADLDVLLVAPQGHQNDPPPGGAGSTITPVGTLSVYWQGRLWLVVGNFVYFDAGPDCTNGIPEESWPPGNRFQFAGPVFGLEITADGVGLLVYLADRVAAILGGPETISFYATNALSNFGISNFNAIFRDGSVIGQFTTQRQYFELLEKEKQEIGSHIADYLTQNFDAASTYVTMHRDGLDVGVFLSNGVDQVLRFGSNISAWSVPAFPTFGAGALRSIETAVGVYSLMLATPRGGVTATVGPVNPTSGTSVGAGTAWLTPNNITLGNPADYATATFAGSGTSAILRAAGYPAALSVPTTAVIQGVTVSIVGKQTTASNLTVTITPTNAVAGAETHTFSFGTTNTTETFGSSTDLWGMPWGSPVSGVIGFDITTANTGGGTPEVFVAEVRVTVTYQNPGNYLYARDTNSWGDAGVYGANNGTPYDTTNITVGSITLSQPGGLLIPLQHVVGYFDAAGTLDHGGPSIPNIWIMPNEISDDAGIGFVYLPEVSQEPPTGQNMPSKSLLSLRWPVNMVNSNTMSQFIHHLQVKIQFEPENAPNTIKVLAFKQDQS